jgi:hypothetical protein
MSKLKNVSDVKVVDLADRILNVVGSKNRNILANF